MHGGLARKKAIAFGQRHLGFYHTGLVIQTPAMLGPFHPRQSSPFSISDCTLQSLPGLEGGSSSFAGLCRFASTSFSRCAPSPGHSLSEAVSAHRCWGTSVKAHPSQCPSWHPEPYSRVGFHSLSITVSSVLFQSAM